MCGGCNENDVVGKYSVVDLDKTLAAIREAPRSLSEQMSLEQYRDHVRKQYADKNLELTSNPPHSFIIPVSLEGAAQGLFTGGWARDTKDRGVILIYQWVSGSVYLLWGRGTLSNGVLTVTLNDGGTNPPIIFLKKDKRNS
jgi:hypothetical protein